MNGIGLFYAPAGVSSPDLKDLTLIYGENARGKSTLASMLSSAEINDPMPILARETIDQTVPAEVCLKFQGGKSATFADGTWKGDISSLRVFDSEFIDRNVHSGSVIDIGHRRNLLDFAIGEKAVAARNRQRALAEAKKELDRDLQSVNAELNKHSGAMPIEEFLALPEVADVDHQIETKDNELDSVKARRAIANQSRPEFLPEPKFKIEDFLEDLSQTLSNFHSTAETYVAEHIERLGIPAARTWISDGQQYLLEESCPFCGQDIRGLDLVKHYQGVFNEEYNALRKRLAEHKEFAAEIFNGCDPDTFRSSVTTNEERVEAWNENDVTLLSPGVTDFDFAQECFQGFNEALGFLIRKKREDMNWVPSKDQEQGIRQKFEEYVELVQHENSIVSSANKAIDEYVETLGQLSENTVEYELMKLKKSKARHLEKVVELATKRNDLTEAIDENRLRAEASRKDERSEMNDLLGNYADSINSFLDRLHAPFKIKDATTNFAGGTPGATYAIEIRRREAHLTGDKHSFRTALSESDKRTMAFAFFLASTFADPDLANQTVVVDDPMSSFDRNRRENTIFALSQLIASCKQLIVLAHDPKFLQQLRAQVARGKKTRPDGSRHKIPIVELKLSPAMVDPNLDYYTQFDLCDLDFECESKYAKNYRIICDFLEEPTRSHEEAAKAIRPLLEGYLHRRFPTRLPKGSMFGVSIKEIIGADASDPLASAKRDVDRLKRIAYFGNDSHHDTDSDYAPPLPSHTATVGFARECLQVIHGA